jgi:hypothetical protein
VHDILLDDRRIKVREITETIGILTERVGQILRKELDMKKLCANWCHAFSEQIKNALA